MNVFTRISEKGQLVVPKATRDRLGWVPGTELEIVETSDAVTLRPRRAEGKLTVTQAVAELRRIYQHEGPPVSVEQLGWYADDDDL